MSDTMLIFPRQLAWNKEAWREPARIGLAIHILQQILADENASPEYLAEAEMLIKKLQVVGKKPAGAF